MKKKQIVLLVSCFVGLALVGIYLSTMPNSDHKFRRVLKFSPSGDTFSLFLEQVSQGDRSKNFFADNASSFVLEGRLKIYPVQHNEFGDILRLTLLTVDPNSHLDVMGSPFPISKFLEGSAVDFQLDNSGKITDVFMEPDMRPVEAEIMKNLVALFEWHDTRASLSTERVLTGIAQVQYRQGKQGQIQKSIKKFIKFPYVSKLQHWRQDISGIAELVLTKEQTVEHIKESFSLMLQQNKHQQQFQLRVSLKHIAPENISSVLPHTAPLKQQKVFSKKVKLQQLYQKLNNPMDTYQQFAKGFSAEDLKRAILTNSISRTWFVQAIARLKLMNNAPLFLQELFISVATGQQQNLIFDLLATLGSKAEQKVMIELLKNYKGDNYTQLIQRFSLLKKPTKESVNFLHQKFNSIRANVSLQQRSDIATIFSYGAVARNLSDEDNERIYRNLENLYQQNKNSAEQAEILLAIANTQNPHLEDFALSLIDSPVSRIRFSVAIMLGEINTSSSKDALLQIALHDQDQNVAAKAMKELIKFSFTQDDFTLLATTFKKKLPSEMVMGRVINILENQLSKKIAPLFPILVEMVNQGNYSSVLTQRIVAIIELYRVL